MRRGIYHIACVVMLGMSLLLLPSSLHAITGVVGAQSDATVPIVTIAACSTFGFVEEAQLTLPVGFNNGIFIRVDQSPSINVGFVITESGTNQQLTVFNLTSMAVIATSVLQSTTVNPGKYELAGRIQGDIDTVNGVVYLFREVIQGGPACAVGNSNCISFAKFNANAVMDGEGITGNNFTNNIDDARDDESGNYLTLSNRDAASGGTGREFRLWSKAGLSHTALGTQFTTTGFGKISRVFNDNLYGMINTETSNGKRVPSGTATSNGTFSVSASFGARLPAAIYGLTTDQVQASKIATESDQTGGVQAFRAYNNETDLVNCCTGNYAIGGTDGAAIFMGTFYDRTNNKVFSARVDGANEELIRTTPGPGTFTVEGTLNCVNCAYNGGSNTGSQVIDYAPHKARLFTISTTSPAVVNRIRVCNTGGPPA